MKKNGFTLAEVLITLGIVGVIAALTIPSMTHNVSKQQVGPALAKGINSLEAANRKALADNGAIRLNDIDDNYFNILDLTLNGVILEESGNTTGFISNDGISYSNSAFAWSGNSANTTVTIDINGSKKPNKGGIDQFNVIIDVSGKVELANDCDIDSPDENCTSKIMEDGWEMKY